MIKIIWSNLQHCRKPGNSLLSCSMLANPQWSSVIAPAFFFSVERKWDTEDHIFKVQLLNCHPLQAPCTLDPFMSHLYLQIEGLWCNNCSFYTSRALTPEADTALQGAEAALWKSSLLSQGLNQMHCLSDRFPLLYMTWLSVHQKNSPCSFGGSGVCWVSRLFPSCSYGMGSAKGGEEVGPPLLVETTILTWSSSSCFTNCWEWITTICNTGY